MVFNIFMYFKQLYICTDIEIWPEAFKRPVNQAYCTRLFRSLPSVERLRSQVQLGEIPAGRLGWYTGGGGVVTNLEPIAWTSTDRAEALLKRDNLAT